MVGTGSRRLRLMAVALAVAAVGLAACDSAEEPASVQVVATTTMLGDIVRNVVGGQASVEVLFPLGADPHEYQASARQVALIQRADVVVVNGLGLEEGLEDVLEAAEADGANIVALGQRLNPIPFNDIQGSDDHGGDDHGGDDPHLWLDPLRMAEAGRIVAAELSAVVPETDWASRAEIYAAELVAADDEIQRILTVVPAGNRKLVTNHSSLGYFADRYGFEVVGTVVPGGSTLGDPSSAELAELVAALESEGIDAIFAETTEPAALAEAVAAEVGEKIAVVDLYTGSLGEPGSGAETLIEMLVTNARLIAEALS